MTTREVIGDMGDLMRLARAVAYVDALALRGPLETAGSPVAHSSAQVTSPSGFYRFGLLCPYCGGATDIQSSDPVTGFATKTIVHCLNCGSSMSVSVDLKPITITKEGKQAARDAVTDEVLERRFTLGRVS